MSKYLYLSEMKHGTTMDTLFLTSSSPKWGRGEEEGIHGGPVFHLYYLPQYKLRPHGEYGLGRESFFWGKLANLDSFVKIVGETFNEMHNVLNKLKWTWFA